MISWNGFSKSWLVKEENIPYAMHSRLLCDPETAWKCQPAKVLFSCPMTDEDARASSRQATSSGSIVSDILCDGRWRGPHGIGRFATEVLPGLPGARILEHGRSLLLSPIDPFWIEWQIARYRPRLYFTPGFNPPVKSRCPFVLTVHDLIHIKIPEERGFLKQVYYSALLKPALKMAERVLTVSEFSRREILDWSGLEPERVHVVGCGVGSAFVPEGPRWNPGYPYFLYVGNHKPHKNLKLLLTAFSRTNPGSGTRLVLTGQPDPFLRKVVSECRIEERIIFLGRVDERDLPALYRGARAVVFPSRYEGFGLPVLEAMACKVPVIAARIPAVEEVAGEGVHFLPVDDTEAWTVTLDQAADDPDFGAARIQEAFCRSASFSWDVVRKRVGEVLRSVRS